MAKQNGNGKMTLTRRDFLKVSAAAGAAGGMLNLASGLDKAGAVPKASVTPDKRTLTTCACCSVGCGQVVEVKDDVVIDVYGDPNHVTNRGALCPKGAATVQWVNGDRRLGIAADDLYSGHPGNTLGLTAPMYRDTSVFGDDNWHPYPGGDAATQWDNAIADVAQRLAAARDEDWPGSPASGANSKSVAFLGCSHATNEENWVYRKLIANIGTNNTEHQARI